MKALLLIVALLTLASTTLILYLLYRDRKGNAQKPSEPVINPPSVEESQGESQLPPKDDNEMTPQNPPAEDFTEQPITGEPVNEPVNEPVDEEPDTLEELVKNILGDRPSSIVMDYILGIYHTACQAETKLAVPELFYSDKSLKPVKEQIECTDERLYAWLLAMVLSELVPERRSEFYQKAYDYKSVGKEAPLYGYTFDGDPSILIMVAAEVWAMTRDAEQIPRLRQELGSTMISYSNDISELYVDICKFLPSAPFPYLSTYRPKGLPAHAETTADVDEEIHKYICATYTLDSKDDKIRQMTIQAISNKEYKKPHLFGKPRTVKDDKYGEMSFNPVFGKHNLGIEIPDNGAIASLAYEVGKVCTDSRKPLLDQEYGRRRPGQGESDPSANKNKAERALVNYAIEEGDGHTTGFYNKGGDYVDGSGNHIGDYETYYQGQLYANSYPSGHSAFIEGVAMVLSLVMPDKAAVIEKAKNEFAISRCICRYHWMSDTIIGRIVGTMMPPVLAATTNFDFDRKLKEAKKEYEAILSGNILTPVEDKVNTSLAYSIGGYGSCHVDAGEASLTHYCNKECYKDRNPSITVNQRVNFTIEGDSGMTTIDGKTTGTFEANVAYVMVCPKVDEGEEKVATITLRNDNGIRILYYTLSRRGTHDDGTSDS